MPFNLPLFGRPIRSLLRCIGNQLCLLNWTTHQLGAGRGKTSWLPAQYIANGVCISYDIPTKRRLIWIRPQSMIFAIAGIGSIVWRVPGQYESLQLWTVGDWSILEEILRTEKHSRFQQEISPYCYGSIQLHINSNAINWLVGGWAAMPVSSNKLIQFGRDLFAIVHQTTIVKVI